MDGDVQIRQATSDDFGALEVVFHDAVSIRARLYSPALDRCRPACEGPLSENGFAVTAPETVMRNGEAFRRFQMEKLLDD